MAHRAQSRQRGSVGGAAVIQARRITAPGTRITMADTTAPTLRLTVVISVVGSTVVEMEEDIDGVVVSRGPIASPLHN